jgi:hypothetical protein
MAGLTVREREKRRREFRGKWVPSREFAVKVSGECAACGDLIKKGKRAVYRRYEGLGAGELVHVACVDK